MRTLLYVTAIINNKNDRIIKNGDDNKCIMENSFVEYRERTDVDSDSETEIIDDSVVIEESFSAKKKPAAKNQTVFVAESEESVSEGTCYFKNTMPILI